MSVGAKAAKSSSARASAQTPWLTLVTRVADGLPLCESLDADASGEVEAYKQHAKVSRRGPRRRRGGAGAARAPQGAAGAPPPATAARRHGSAGGSGPPALLRGQRSRPAPAWRER